MSKTVFITGTTGLVGAHLSMQLAQRGDKIRALRRKSSDLEPLRKLFSFYQLEDHFHQIEWTEGNLDDVRSIANGMVGCSRVFHCAAVVSYHPKRRKEMIASNIEGTANVVNAALDEGVERFVHVSSVAALGTADRNGVVNENSKWLVDKHTSGYSISKHFSEREVWRGFQEGLNGLILNPSIIIGPGYWNKSSSSLFEKVFSGLNYFGSGSSGFVDVRDVAKALLLLEESELNSERFTLVAEHLHFKSLFSRIAQALKVAAPSKEAKPLLAATSWRLAYLNSILTGKEPLITKETVHAANSHVKYDSSKFLAHFNFEFTPIQESIAHTAKVFKATY